jgi:hypothetical protein
LPHTASQESPSREKNRTPSQFGSLGDGRQSDGTSAAVPVRSSTCRFSPCAEAFAHANDTTIKAIENRVIAA